MQLTLYPTRYVLFNVNYKHLILKHLFFEFEGYRLVKTKEKFEMALIYEAVAKLQHMEKKR